MGALWLAWYFHTILWIFVAFIDFLGVIGWNYDRIHGKLDAQKKEPKSYIKV